MNASHMTGNAFDDAAHFITFAETLVAHPGGISGLARAMGVSTTTVRRVRDTMFARFPRHHLQRLVNAGSWDAVPGMAGRNRGEQASRLRRLYRRAKRRPVCGHSVCSQHFTETGMTHCIERSSRQRGLLV